VPFQLPRRRRPAATIKDRGPAAEPLLNRRSKETLECYRPELWSCPGLRAQMLLISVG